MKKRTILMNCFTYWGDIVWLLAYPAYRSIHWNSRFMWSLVEPSFRLFVNRELVIGLFIGYSIFFVIAFVRLIILRKKRALRDWLYPFYGLLSAICMSFYLLAAYVPEKFTFYPADYIGAALELSVILFVGFGIGRFIVWLVKRRKKATVK